MKGYSTEENALMLVALLKAYGIRKIIASPGTTNLAFVASLQCDPFFQVYSAPEERSAAYMACGMAQESGEPVVITCTGATASRNYLPGLTEAFYRKLPILAVTATQGITKVGHLIAQVIDRSSIPADCACYSTELPVIKDNDDRRHACIRINKALISLRRLGGGPVHINLATSYDGDFSAEHLPDVQKIAYYEGLTSAPSIPEGRIAVFIGSHQPMNKALEEAIDAFCAKYNAVAFCDHTSNFKGKYRVQAPLMFSQDSWTAPTARLDLMIHIGEVSGAYAAPKALEVWRVSPDGEIRDTFRNISAVFAVNESDFFRHYAANSEHTYDSFLTECKNLNEELWADVPENIPFSNVWIARRLSRRLPQESVLTTGILNSLRSWNFFEIPNSVDSYCNVGGFGIDGCLSTLIGAAITKPEKIFYAVLGDLAFFYDMNSLGNRHTPANIRIILINNGKGTEFRNYNHMGSFFGEDADKYIAAGGHYGNRSKTLVKHYAEDLGFEYITAASKDEFTAIESIITSDKPRTRPLIAEIFTDSTDENDAVFTMRHLRQTKNHSPKEIIRNAIGNETVRKFKSILGR